MDFALTALRTITTPSVVQVFRGVGGGAFEDGGNYVVGMDAEGLAAHDLDGDGIVDLVVGNEGEQDVQILQGLADGGFAPQAPMPVGGYVTAVAVADETSDGHPDIVAFSGAGLACLPHLPDGGWDSPVTTAASPYVGILADLNGDSIADALYVLSTGGMEVRLGNGDCTFGPPTTYAIDGAANIAVGDLNRDGLLDVAVSSINPTEGVVTVLLGAGAGVLGNQTTFDASASTDGVAIGDFDGDGFLDIAAASHSTPATFVALGNGDGTFQSVRTFATDVDGVSLTVGDLNGDGRDDLVVPSHVAVDVNTLEGTCQ
ncbi:MAG: VCBS repeat-containing protein [Deltaproteobacteria bacterium]|nr:VCBS repeat-containing protein [Deltaproteobacteria bacterium]